MLNINQIFEQMTLREKIGQMFLQYFKGYTDLPDALIRMNQENYLGGLILFSGNNVRDIQQLHALTTTIQSYAKDNKYQLPFLIGMDQEGGQLTAVFKGTTIFPGNMVLGFTGDPELAFKQGAHVGKELAYGGINLCFGPVLDVDYDVQNGVPIVDNRRYSSDPKVVAQMGQAYIKGLESEGVLACGKHFPGMRITEVDTHFQVDRSPYDMERLKAVEMAPFQAAIEGGLRCLMTHHGIFEAFDTEFPASLSPKVTAYLRGTMAFDGLVVTDDLIMKAILDTYGEEAPIHMAINAGADVIISTCASTWFIDYVEKCVQEGIIPKSRIDEACYRILNYKHQMDVGRVVEQKTFDATVGDNLSKTIASKGMMVYKGDKEALPIVLNQEDKLGIVLGNPARLVMSDATNLYDLSLKDTLLKEGLHTNIKEAIMPWNPTEEEIISLTDIGIISDVIVIVTVNAYRFKGQLKVLKTIREACPNKTIIAVASRSPMDAKDLCEDADYVLVTGGMTESVFSALSHMLFDPDRRSLDGI